MATQILRLPNVIAKTGLSRASIYHKMSEGTFPKQIKLSTRTVGWLENDIEAWLESLIKLSRKTT